MIFTIIGLRNGFTASFLNDMRNNGITPLPHTFHCIIHQENLCAKTLQLENIYGSCKWDCKKHPEKGIEPSAI